MRCLALRHIPCEDLGSFEEPLRQRFDEVTYIDMDKDGSLHSQLEEAAEAELVVSLGGPMAVYEAGQYPFLQREIELIRDRIINGKATLGICLGSQIMAAAAGARVFSSGKQEIGWYPIDFTPEAVADPVAGKLTEGSSMFFHWHGDTFDIPAGAKLLGSSRLFPHQGFTIGRHALALQFHAEVDAESLEAWLEEYKNGLKAGPGVMGIDEMRAMTRLHGPSLAARGRAFLNQWLESLSHFRCESWLNRINTI